MTVFVKLPLLLLGATLSLPVAAQNAFYLGGAVGNTSVDSDFDDTNLDFDDDDTAWSGFAGVQATDFFGIEASYNDFGKFLDSRDVDFTQSSLAADLTGYDIMAVLTVPLGPLRLYGKGGVVFWDAKATAQILPAVGSPYRLDYDEDGNDLAFGGGLELQLSRSFALRGEVEYFDIENTEQVWFASLGLSYRF